MSIVRPVRFMVGSLGTVTNHSPKWREETSNEWAKTKPKIVKFFYTWNIENFSVLCEFKDDLKSPKFPADAEHGVKWVLKLTKRNSDISGNEYLALYLQLDNWDGTTDIAKVRCSILNHEETLQKTSFTMSNHANIIIEPFIYCGALFDKTKNLLPNDVLTILCEIFILTDTVCTCGSTKPIKVSEPKISDDFANLFESKKFSDVTIVTVDGQEIQAHKIILSARCEVFDAMFNKEMEEQLQGRVTINDINPGVLTEMLRFIYTDKAPKLETMSEDLLAAANKYLLERLKNMCESFLLDRLTIDNAAETFILANTHNACQLRAHTIDFINDKKDEVMQTIAWKHIALNYPKLVREYFLPSSHPSNPFLPLKSNYRKYSCEKCS